MRLLKSLGMDILSTNFSGSKGEIDVIARDGAVLCFVEVKTRRNASRTRPADAVTATKRKRLLKTADLYLRLLGQPKVTRRLDVIEVIYRNNRLADLRYWPDEIRKRDD